MTQPIPKNANIIPRIFLLTEVFGPSFADGVAKISYQLAERLTSKGLELFVITRQTEPPSADFERVGNILVRRIPPRGHLKGKGWKALGPLLLFLIRTLYLLIKYLYQYDIIVVSGLKILSIPAVLVSMVGHKKCIIVIQSPIELWEDISSESLRKMNISQSSILLNLLRNMRNILVKRADFFVVISSEIRRELIGIGMDPQKIRSIPNGVDTDKFCSVSKEEKLRIRQRLSIPVDKIVFIFTGRLATSKGLISLIHAWKDLVYEYKDIYLLLVGSGKGSFDNCEDELRDDIKVHKLEQSVSITGDVDNVYEYLQASDIFVFPSEYEGFSLSLIEALACGLPTVATRVGAAGELIENYKSGILVDPKNQKEIQTAMEWLLDHKGLWSTIGTNAQKGVVEKYSIEVMAEKYLEMFTELQKNKKYSYSST